MLAETSQTKLLKQVAETIETQLDDGERRITAVRKASSILLRIWKFVFDVKCFSLDLGP